VGLVFRVLLAATPVPVVAAVVVAVVAGQLFYYKIIRCGVWPPAAAVVVEQAILARVAAVPDPTAKLAQGLMVNQEQVIQVTAAAAVAAVEDATVTSEVVVMVEHMAGGQVQAILVDKQETLVPAGVLPIQMDSTPVVEHPADNRESQYRLGLGKAGDREATAVAMDMQ
jgi:hypothetical protein